LGVAMRGVDGGGGVVVQPASTDKAPTMTTIRVLIIPTPRS